MDFMNSIKQDEKLRSFASSLHIYNTTAMTTL